MELVPKRGFKGLTENWQSDLIAAISVSLVALPLALGIAIASEVPPMAGVFSAIIGGIVTTFFRGSHVAINGPAAGLIAVILSAVAALNDGSGQTLNYVFAAIVVSGAIQVVLGLLKLGKLAEIFHSSVIHGILAAIGVIIFSKQIHFALGLENKGEGPIGTIMDAIYQIPNINPFVFSISLVGLLLLIFHSKINYKFFQMLPAPMWLLVISIPFVYAFNFFDAHSLSMFGKLYEVGPHLLVNIPDNIAEAISYPNFSKIDTLPFWTSVLSITMIASIESLASSKAIDKLDPYKRKTDLNKDLIGIGLGTMVSGMLGGLPIITVIVRSTVNIHNHAKTKWSNLYHGIILLEFVFILTPFIQKVPLCALAILLVYTGYKLASPKVFKHVYDQGIEQLIFFSGTLFITLKTDLLVGIFGGLLLALLAHFLLARVSIGSFFKMIFKSDSNLYNRKDDSYELKITGIANFLAKINIENLIKEIPTGTTVNIDLSEARLVDFTILESLYDFQRIHASTGGKAEFTGLDNHISSSKHKLALKLQTSSARQLTRREIQLKEMAIAHDWDYELEPENGVDYLGTFYFFKSRPIAIKSNCISGKHDDVEWQIVDVLFEEGAFIASAEYETTVGLIKMPFSIPVFTIEKKDFLDKYIHILEHKDIDYTVNHDFSKDFTVKVLIEDDVEISKAFFKELDSLITNSSIHHVESNGEAILIFNNDLRLAQIRTYAEMIKFKTDITKLMIKESGVNETV